MTERSEPNALTELGSKPLLAHLRATQQVGPDDWERCSSFLRVTRETTVGEIIDWRNSIHYTSLIRLELCDADDSGANKGFRGKVA